MTRYTGRHRATCDVPPTAYPDRLARPIAAARATVAWLGGTWALALLIALLAVGAAHELGLTDTVQAWLTADPLPLTLTDDPGHWNPTATLDTAQVQSP